MSYEVQLTCNQCGKLKVYFNQSKGIGWCHYCKKVVRRKDIEIEDGSDFILDSQGYSGNSSSTSPAWENVVAGKYLKSRWVDELTSATVGIRYDAERESIRVPIHSPASEFPMSHQVRGIYPGGRWYTEAKERKEYCFGLPWVPISRKEVILVEGIFDVLTPGWLGYAIATLGTTLSDTLCLFLVERFNRIYIWFDPDPAGRSGGEKVLRQLHMAGASSTLLEYSIEPGDMGPSHPLAVEWRNKLDDLC